MVTIRVDRLAEGASILASSRVHVMSVDVRCASKCQRVCFRPKCFISVPGQEVRQPIPAPPHSLRTPPICCVPPNLSLVEPPSTNSNNSIVVTKSCPQFSHPHKAKNSRQCNTNPKHTAQKTNCLFGENHVDSFSSSWSRPCRTRCSTSDLRNRWVLPRSSFTDPCPNITTEAVLK